MPTYEYDCSSCGNSHEVFQSISAPDPASCPQCGAAELKRKIFAPHMLFKGDGFYTTEYRSSDYQEAAKMESGASEEASTSSDTSSKESSETSETSKTSSED